MKSTLQKALILLAVFGVTALILGLVVDFDGEDVRRWLVAAQDRPALVFAVVVMVLAIDSVLAVPTITTVVVAGYLLGPFWGAVSSFIGMMLAGSICFWGGRVVGAGRWAKGQGPADGDVGPVALLVARSAPMLPEVLSAMAGSARMRAHRYYLYFGLGNLPFAVLVAYAGSVSTLEQPWPAIVAGMAVPIIGAAVVWWRRATRRAGQRRHSAGWSSST